MTVWRTQVAFVVTGESTYIRSGSQESVTYRRDNQIADQRIGRSQSLLYTASVRAVGNVKFCRNLLVRQLHQPIPTCWLMQNRKQLLLRISDVPKL